MTETIRFPVEPGPPLALPDVLDFMQLLWAVVHGLERSSKAMAVDLGVTGPQRLVLRVVGLFPGVSAGDLAAVLHVHPSTLTGVLQRLIAQRMLVRVAAPSDRRRAVLRLTPRGARVNAKRRGTIEAAVAAALARTRPADRLAARRVLQRLAERLGANAAEITDRAKARDAARRGGNPRRRS
jgi:MarR family transcriptional regulator, organic hydroperoxide resistance regulator